MEVNREYKSGMFAKLFSDGEALIDLYNAISGSTLPGDTSVDITTLTNVLFNTWRDDVAFLLGDRLVILVEHQSTINYNMPARMFIYAARIYENLIDNNLLYKKSIEYIPKPDFIVLYNGTDDYPDDTQLYLSDAYKNLPGAPGLGGSLELTVRVLNINLGHNQEIIERCKKLHGYVRFIAEVRRNQSAGMTLTEAVTQATFVCSKEEYIPEFLRAHGSEVLNWMTLIYDQKEAEKYIREEGREEGIVTGIVRGREEGIINILRSLINDNYPMSAIRNLAGKHGISDERINQLMAEEIFVTKETIL